MEKEHDMGRVELCVFFLRFVLSLNEYIFGEDNFRSICLVCAGVPFGTPTLWGGV